MCTVPDWIQKGLAQILLQTKNSKYNNFRQVEKHHTYTQNMRIDVFSYSTYIG